MHHIKDDIQSIQFAWSNNENKNIDAIKLKSVFMHVLSWFENKNSQRKKYDLQEGCFLVAVDCTVSMIVQYDCTV